MMLLYKKECKKLFLKPITFVLFLIAVGFGIVMMGNNISETELSGVDDQGTYVEGTSSNKLFYDIQNEYAGEVTQAWFTKVKEDFLASTIKDNLAMVDEASMVNTYGDNWKEAYIKNPTGYEYYSTKVVEDYKKQNPGQAFETSKPIFFLKDYRASIRTSALGSALQYGERLIDRPWNEEVKETMINSEGERSESLSQFSRSLKPEERDWLVQQLNAIPSFSFASSEGWDNLLSGMASARFFIAIFILFATSRLFNEDHGYDLYDTIKSTTYGKTKLVFAKLLALLSFCVLTILFYTAFLTTYLYLTEGLGDWNVNLQVIMNSINLYTIKEAYIGGFLYLLAGACFIGFLSAFCSTIIKKTYLSFLASMLLLLLPLIFPSSIKLFFPIEYMDFTGTFFYNQTTSLLGGFQMTQPFVYGIALGLVVVCSILITLYYRSYRIHNV